MDWYQISFAGLVGASFVGLGALAARALGLSKASAGVLIAVFMSVGTFVVKPVLDSRLDPVFQEWRVERALSSLSLYRLIKSSDPDTYELLLSTMLKPGLSESQQIGRVRTVLGKRMREWYLPRASDQAIVAYQGVSVLQLEYLAKTNMESCLGMVRQRNTLMFDNQELNAREQAAATEVIRSGLGRIEPVRPDVAEAEATAREAFDAASLSAIEVNALAEPMGAGPELCQAAIKYNRSLLSLSSERAANVIRSDLSTQQP